MNNGPRKLLLKVISLLFSFILWIYVIGTADTQLNKTVYVRYIVPEGKAIVSEDVKEVTFHLTGPRAFIRTLQDRDESITIDISKLRRKVRGKIEVSFKSTDIALPFGVKVNKIEPSKVYLEIEKAIIKKVPLKLVSTGELPRDQKMIGAKVEPQFIQVMGPASVMKELTHIKTLPIDISNLSGEGKVNLEVSIDDDRISRIDTESLTYQYQVKPTRANMVLRDIPIHFLTSKVMKRAERRKVSLIILADQGKEAEAMKDKIRVIAEIPENASGKIEVELKATMPEGLHLLEIQPQKIFVYVQ
mgnify:CR=1 FL=1